MEEITISQLQDIYANRSEDAIIYIFCANSIIPKYDTVLLLLDKHFFRVNQGAKNSLMHSEKNGNAKRFETVVDIILSKNEYRQVSDSEVQKLIDYCSKIMQENSVILFKCLKT